MKSFHGDHWWLLLAPVPVTALDALLTLLGQPSAYYSAGYHTINEVNPIGRWFLSVHPAFFVFGIALWIVLYGAAILLLPKYLALVLATAVTLGHTWGASTWLPVWAVVILWVIALLVLAWIWIWVRSRIAT